METRDPYNDENEDAILHQLEHPSLPMEETDSQRNEAVRAHTHRRASHSPEA